MTALPAISPWIYVGGVRLERSLSYSCPDDDNFKLWSETQAGVLKWTIVYCAPKSHYVDYWYWSGSAWVIDGPLTYFTAEELQTQVPAAWAKRKETT